MGDVNLPNDPKLKFIKLMVQGSSSYAIMPENEVADFCDGEEYIEKEVWMTQREFDALPEFEGY